MRPDKILNNLIKNRHKISAVLAAAGVLVFALTLLGNEVSPLARLDMALAGFILVLAGALLRFAWPELWAELGFFALLTAPFFTLVTVKYIHLDFWGGEIDNLTRYVFAPLPAGLIPGGGLPNPALASLLERLVLWLQGVTSLAVLLDDPARIRYLMLGISALTLVYLYLTGKKFVGNLAGFLAVIVLATSIPFYNFAVQVDGYSLSILLVCMLLFHWWSFEENPALVHGVMVAATAGLLVYNAPSNFNILAGAAAYALVGGIYLQSGRSVREAARSPQLMLVWLCLGGAITAALFYLPFFGAGQIAKHVASGGMLSTTTITSLLAQVLDNFISTRFLMILGAALGWYFSTRGEEARLAERCGFLAMLLLGPFMVSFVRGDAAPEQAFLALLPVFSLLVGLGLTSLFQNLPNRFRRKWIVLAAVGLYLVGAFYAEANRVEALLQAAPANEHNLQTLYSNYYQAAYHPLDLLRDFRKTNYQPGFVLEVYQWGDQAAALAYLQKFNISTQILDSLDNLRLNSQGTAYVFTTFPARFEQDVEKSLPELKCVPTDSRPGYWKIFLCKRK